MTMQPTTYLDRALAGELDELRSAKIARRYVLTMERGSIRRRLLRYPLCGERGCKQPANACYFPDDSRQFYCYNHMRDMGFCPGCGQFWAGVETFDFSRTGYCENCEGDNFDFDEDLEEWDDWFDPYFYADEQLRDIAHQDAENA